jgi:hypothetical protein
MSASLRPRPEVCVLRTDPEDGSTGVLCDAAVLAILSGPIDDASVWPGSVRLCDGEGEVPGGIETLGMGQALLFRPTRRLRAGVPHEVVIAGLRDRQGRPVPSHVSRFVPWGLALSDLASVEEPQG